MVADAALNERDYGALAGLNKTQARAQFGVEQVRSWRKSYAAVPPGGESLAMAAERVWPFFEGTIVPRLRAGASVLVVAHGNSLRALLVQLDGIAPEAIEEVNLGTAEFLVYGPRPDGGWARIPPSSLKDRPGYEIQDDPLAYRAASAFSRKPETTFRGDALTDEPAPTTASASREAAT